MISDETKAIKALTQMLEGGYTLRSMDFITEKQVNGLQVLANHVVILLLQNHVRGPD